MLYLFEDYALDTVLQELRRGGAVLSVEPQIFDLLLYLVRNRERVVSQNDLLTGVWDGRIVSESTLRSRITAARAAIGDSGESQHLIRTLPRKGFRFVGSVREEQGIPAVIEPLPGAMTATAPAESPPFPEIAVQPAIVTISPPVLPVSVSLPPAAPPARPRIALILSTCAALGAIAAVLYLAWPMPDRSRIPSPSAAAQRFDPTVVPLVTDEARRALSTYAGRPDVKALAIAGDRFSVVDGAHDAESAIREALNRCNTRLRKCKIYAVGMDVVWSKESVPMAAPADLRTEPLAIALQPDDIPTLPRGRRTGLSKSYMTELDPRALALTTGQAWFVSARGSIAEATRLALERCGDRAQRPCLILSVNGFLTIQIPRTRQVDRIFLPATEEDLADHNRDHIAQVYQGREWRALARGKKGSWHPVANEPSELAAIDVALKACAQVDDACTLYAIGNFRVVQD